MSDHISHFRHARLHAQTMLRLPIGAEFWGAVGPHQIHDLPPLGVVAAAGWVWGMARTLVGWVIRSLRQRTAGRLAAAADPQIGLLPDASGH